MAPEHLMEDLYAPAPDMPMMKPQDKMLRDFTLPNLPVSELQKKTAATQKLPEGSTDKRGWGFTLEKLPEEEPRIIGGNTGTPDYLMKKPMAPEHLMEEVYAPEMPMMMPEEEPQIIGGNTGTPDYLMKKPMAPEHLMED